MDEVILQDSAADILARRINGGVVVTDCSAEIYYGRLPDGSDANTVTSAMAFWRSGYAVGSRVGIDSIKRDLRKLIGAAQNSDQEDIR